MSRIQWIVFPCGFNVCEDLLADLLERLSWGCTLIRICVEIHVKIHVVIMLAFLMGSWMSSSGFIGVTRLNVSLTGMSFPFWIKLALGPFLEVSICRVVSPMMLGYGGSFMLEISIFSQWKFS